MDDQPSSPKTLYFCYCCGKILEPASCYSVHVGNRHLISCKKCIGSYLSFPYISYSALRENRPLRGRKKLEDK